MTMRTSSSARSDLGNGVLIGLAGGLAEVLWVGAYSLATGENGFDIARAVTDTVFPGHGTANYGILLGLVIHFALSIALGLIIVKPLARLARTHRTALVTSTLAGLGTIWAVNFLVVLPVVNPAFPIMLPVWVSLTSKLCFGLAAAALADFAYSSRDFKVRLAALQPRSQG